MVYSTRRIGRLPPRVWFDSLVAAVDVTHAVDHGLAPGRQRRSTARRCPQVDAITPAPVSSRGPDHDGLLPSSGCWAHARQPLGVHKAVLEKFVSMTIAMPSACVISAMYCALKIGRKAGILLGVMSTERSGAAPDPQRAASLVSPPPRPCCSFGDEPPRCPGCSPSRPRRRR